MSCPISPQPTGTPLTLRETASSRLTASTSKSICLSPSLPEYYSQCIYAYSAARHREGELGICAPAAALSQCGVSGSGYTPPPPQYPCNDSQVCSPWFLRGSLVHLSSSAHCRNQLTGTSCMAVLPSLPHFLLFFTWASWITSQRSYRHKALGWGCFQRKLT